MREAGHSDWPAFPRRHPWWSGSFALLALLIVLLAFLNWNWARGPIQRAVYNMTGRELHIDGDLDLDFIPLEVSAEKIRFGNASWSEQPVMASADRLEARVRFWPLLAGRFTLPRLTVDQPYLRIERNSQGVGNWVFGDPQRCKPGGCKQRLRILQLHAEQGQLEVREPTLQTAIDIRFDSAAPATPDSLEPLVLRGNGTYRNAPFELSGQVDSPLELQGKPLPYSLDLRAQAGETMAHASGTLAEPLQTENIALDFEMRGPDLAQLYEFVGLVLPKTPPYALKGLLSRNGNRISYQDFAGTVGDSDLSGDATVDIGGDRPKLIAKLSSKLIDFDDLAASSAAAPPVGEVKPHRRSEAGGEGRRPPASCCPPHPSSSTSWAAWTQMWNRPQRAWIHQSCRWNPCPRTCCWKTDC